jgi:type I restriction enzyme S subunit
MSEEAKLDEFVKGQDECQHANQQKIRGETVPTDWDVVSIDDISEQMGDGGTPSRQSDSGYFGGDITWVVVDDVEFEIEDSKERLTEKGLDNSSATLWPEGSVIVTTGASIGEVGIAKQPTATKQGITGIIPANKINSHFLGRYLEANNATLNRFAQGTTFEEIRPYILRNVEMALAPLPEQRKIATVLYTVDQAIEKTEEVIEQVRTVKQGILQDLMNGAGSDLPTEEKRVGPRVVSLPKDWEVVQIGDALERSIIIEQQDGNHGSDYPSKNEFVDEGIPYLSAEMLSEGEVNFSQAKYLTEERANQLRIGFAKDGDVVLAHNATVGPAGLLETTRDFVIIGTSLTYYRCNSDKLHSHYLTYFFQSGTFQKQLKDVMRQSTRNQVPITRQRNLHLILPPIKKQRDISNQIATIKQTLQTEHQYHRRLQRVKRGLTQDLLSGTVRTTDTNIQVPDEIGQYG